MTTSVTAKAPWLRTRGAVCEASIHLPSMGYVSRDPLLKEKTISDMIPQPTACRRGQYHLTNWYEDSGLPSG